MFTHHEGSGCLEKAARHMVRVEQTLFHLLRQTVCVSINSYYLPVSLKLQVIQLAQHRDLSQRPSELGQRPSV